MRLASVRPGDIVRVEGFGLCEVLDTAANARLTTGPRTVTRGYIRVSPLSRSALMARNVPGSVVVEHWRKAGRSS